MLDRFVIFAKTGVVLWSVALMPDATAGEAHSAMLSVNGLVREVLLRDSSATSWVGGEHTIKYVTANQHDLVFAAVASRQFASSLGYVDPLLSSVRRLFVERYGEDILAAMVQGRPFGSGAYDNFGTAFEKLLGAAEAGARGGGSGKGGPSSAQQQQQRQAREHTPSHGTDGQGGPASNGAGAAGGSEGAGAPSSGAPSDLPAEDTDEAAQFASLMSARERLAARKGPGGGRPGSASKAGSPKAGAASATSAKATGASSSGGGGKPKAGRQWDDFSFNEKAAAALDRSVPQAEGAGGGGEGAAASVERVSYSGAGASGSGRDVGEGDADDYDVAAVLEAEAAAAAARGTGGGAASGAAAPAATGVSSWFLRSAVGAFLSTLTGNKVVEEADLVPVMESLRAQLVSKNVASEIAVELCEAVSRSILGTKVAVAGSVAVTVQRALRDAIERILTPRRSIDILADVRAKKAAKAGPYVIVFVGINGVGKSTSLAKTAFHLRDHGHSVLIAACDSFRSGAVEQLKRHCAALDVPLFSKGYAKDPVSIASAAIKEAAGEGIDVVLVDTAGRMQNNAPLMQQLAKLVAVNSPDLVLMVAEALVGSDGVDQLSQFDKALVDFAVDSSRPRRIDGVLLTKFDTVDDKVGATLSMVYKTGIPIVFLGVGQKYQDLRKLNVGFVVKQLLS